MFKRITSLLLAGCLLTGFSVFNIPSMTAYADEPFNDTANVAEATTEVVAIESGTESSDCFSLDEYILTHEDESMSVEVSESAADPQDIDMSASEPLVISRALRGVVAAQATTVTRYIVLILDNSGSMSGTPLTRTKQAAIKFCEQVLAANGNNYVAIVQFNTNASEVCAFTNELTQLSAAINSIYSTGSTNHNAALQKADQLLQAVQDSVIKNIVLRTKLPQSAVVLREFFVCEKIIMEIHLTL
ncbi:MAG: VWA domain-containing protein [Clostridiales bacterium]|jgi:Mg-chelatase subunit ChlD|nr:VWA domain-containing protein [Clostridiales bacterium]